VSLETATDHEPEAADTVVIRRNLWLSGVVAVLAALIGLGYVLRGSTVLDTVAGVVLLLIAAVHAAALGPARSPVLVADEHGIRMRVGLAWRGLPWGSVRQLVVEHADNPLREGRLVVVPRDPGTTLDRLDGLARLHLRWNELWYDAALSVPLGMTTLTDSADLGGDLATLADGRTDVVHLRGRQLAQLDEVVAPPRDDEVTTDEVAAESAYHAVAHADTDEHPAIQEPLVEDLPEPVAPVRPLNRPARVEVRLDAPAIGRHDEPFVPAQRRPDELGQAETAPVDAPQLDAPDLEHAEAWEEVPVEIEAVDLVVHTPVEPVIGPEIARARHRLALSIEDLSERTRIRPHVIEAIEIDDFGPCGGDFYARGHLNAIARVLGLPVEPLMKDYDDRYAGGPINARRVFEAELATGLSGGMSATRGGPHWMLLVGAVLCLTMVWGVARLLSGDPAQMTSPPVSTSESAGLAANQQPITSPLMKTTKMTVTAAHAGAHVVVRDRTGRILWSGDLRMTRHRQVVGLAPFKVESDNAGAIEVTVAGEALGTIGKAGEQGSKRFG
jgi:cytoskeleton protein RodZ